MLEVQTYELVVPYIGTWIETKNDRDLLAAQKSYLI